MADHLPAYRDDECQPTLRHLASNQSGICDYWCQAMLTGATADSTFRSEDAQRLLKPPLSFMFPPGSAFAYSNTNFALLGNVAERVYGQPLSEILRDEIFEPLKMNRSLLAPVTSAKLEGLATGYEYAPDGRRVPCTVDIEWFGDAGIVSTLADLERWNQVFEEPEHPLNAAVRSLTEPLRYTDGRVAPYRLGIRVGQLDEDTTETHHGALRGWRMVRLRLPDQALSVLVLFNHMSDPGPIAENLARLALGRSVRSPEQTVMGDSKRWFSSNQKLLVGIGEQHNRREVSCGGRTDRLFATDDALVFESPSRDVELSLTKPPSLLYRADNHRLSLEPVVETPADRYDYLGSYHSPKLDTTVLVEFDRTIRFLGPLGSTPALKVIPVSEDLWLLPCYRALDHHPPGEFTLKFERTGQRVTSLSISCWLARSEVFVRRSGDADD